jgi:hypothetical protein
MERNEMQEMRRSMRNEMKYERAIETKLERKNLQRQWGNGILDSLPILTVERLELLGAT